LTFQDILPFFILILQRLGEKKWRQFVLSSPAIIKPLITLFTPPPCPLKTPYFNLLFALHE